MIKKLMAVALIFTVTTAFGMSVKEVNKASKEELMKINGVGDKKADAIIKYRKKSPFKSFTDLEEVKGVGPALSKNIQNDVYKKAPKKKKESKKKKDSKKKKSDSDKK